MKLCPVCEGDYIVKAKVKKTGQIIKICPECDTVWENKVSSNCGCSYEAFLKERGLRDSWDELEIEDNQDDEKSRHDMNPQTTVILENYFPLTVSISNSDTQNEYLSFSKNAGSLLELTIDAYDHCIKKILLLISEKYEYFEKPLTIDSYEEARIGFSKGTIECDCFKTIVYLDGVKIVLSSKVVSRYVKTGNVFFGLSEANDLREVCVCDMSMPEVKHLKAELELHHR